ncbi:MAG: glycosyltransferase family 87 protein [Salibacteraceae bacterium]
MVFKVDRLPLWVFFTPLFAIGIYFTIQSTAFSLHDYTNYFFGAKLWLKGDFISSSYLPCTFNEQLEELGFSEYFGNFAPNSPTLLLVFAPLTFLSAHQSKLIFNLIGLIVFTISFYRLCCTFRIQKISVLLISIVLFLPMRNNLLFGQAYLILTALIIEFSINYSKKRFWISTFWLALASALKLFPAVLVMVFIVRKDVHSVLRYALWLIIILGFTTLMVGIETMEFYLIHVAPASMLGRMSEEFVLNYQSVQMWSKALFVMLPNYYLNPLANLGPHASTFLNTLLTGTVVFMGVGYTLRSPLPYVISVWVVIGLLITPYGSSYSLILLGVVAALAISPKKSKRFWTVLVLVILVSLVRYKWFAELPIYFQFPKLFIMSALLLALVLYKPFVFKPLVFVAICFLFGAKFWMSNSNLVKREYAISPKSLVCEYRVDGNSIILKGLNRKGERQWVETLGPCTNFEKQDLNRGLGYFTLYCK